MLNRTKASSGDPLDARRVITAQLRDSLRDLPATPFDWSTFDPARALRDGGHTPDLRLLGMTRLLCTAPARSAELRALWNECVVTAAYALRLAPVLRADPAAAAVAALLHRLGDILTIRAIGFIEHSSRLRLDAPGKADLCAELGGEQLERAVRAWGVPPRAAATAAEWRRLREFPDAAAEATVVYLSRLFAIELLAPQFCVPGTVEHACEEVGVDSGTLSGLRRDATIAALLSNLQ
ncbi:MAG: HDOD domain-containing protein [Pseudomonadota bacterium]